MRLLIAFLGGILTASAIILLVVNRPLEGPSEQDFIQLMGKSTNSASEEANKEHDLAEIYSKKCVTNTSIIGPAKEKVNHSKNCDDMLTSLLMYSFFGE